MRSVCAAFMTLVLIGQAVTPFSVTPGYVQHLDRRVPVATVAPIGQPMALAGALRVETAPEPFVLGAATIDLGDPSRAAVVFTMTNATDTPIRRNTVVIEEYSVMIRPETREFFFPSLGGRLEPPGMTSTAWRPGQQITVRIPISPVPKDGALQGFLVLVQTDDTPRRAGGDSALLIRAFERLKATSAR